MMMMMVRMTDHDHDDHDDVVGCGDDYCATCSYAILASASPSVPASSGKDLNTIRM